MKIAWFTPFHSESSIGKVSLLVLRSLNQDHHVDLWLNNADNLLSTEFNTIFYAKNHSIDSHLCRSLSQYDYIFYNLGNHYLNHIDIYEVSKMHPGIVILHDFVNHHFFIEYYDKRNQLDDYTGIMASLYGKKALKAVQDSRSGKRKPPIWEDIKEIIHFPLFEPMISHAKGVITHSNWAYSEIKAFFPGPVANIPLAHSVGNLVNNTPKSIKALTKTKSSSKIKLLTTGHVNANRCIEQVIEVLGKNKKLADQVEYVILGAINPQQPYYLHLKALIEEYALENVVTFLGYQPDSVLLDYLSETDICITLRNPALESASGSTLEQMYFGKAIIVLETGFYAELPDDTVRKIKLSTNPSHPLEKQLKENDLEAALIELINNPLLRIQLGKNAKQYCLTEHTPDAYKKHLLDFCQKMEQVKPALNLIDTVSAELKNLCVQSFMPGVEIIAQEIDLMVNSSDITNI